MNNNIKIYCVTDKPLPKLEISQLKLAGVGKNIFSDFYLKSDNKENIHLKNSFILNLHFIIGIGKIY